MLLTEGCGRVGIELLYDTGDAGQIDDDGGIDLLDGAVDEDGGAEDGGAEDAAASDGASADAASGDGATPCVPSSSTDTTCNGVDDDCNGSTDDGYVAVGGCGVGYCQTNATASRCTAGVETACQPAAPLSSNDATLDQIDDDCDGTVDEDACIARTETFGPGMHTLSQRSCTRITVKLWGGAGAAGDSSGGYWGLSITGGAGGAGGYAQGVLTVTATSQVQVFVGQGGRNCDLAGTNSNAAYNGGAGGANSAQAGTAGADGTQAGGTGGTTPALAGGKGGNGSNGGGGGGAGTNSGYAKHGKGGAGGAATVALVVNGASILAGGGGGGGGAGSDFTTLGHSGANGGSGCGANGVNGDQGGGGGGGGVCRGGSDMRQGTGRTPHDPEGLLTSGSAVGGVNTSDCAAGGNGYAVVTFAP